MSEIAVNGVTLHYELHGRGLSVVLVPGGRAELGCFRPLAGYLAHSHRVLIHDRRNCGASGVAFDQSFSELELWVEDLHVLMNRLGMTPAYVGGASAGSAIAIHLARRHPRDVKGLLLWELATSDPLILRAVADNWYGRCIELARQGGMAAVIEASYFGKHLTLSPTSRERLLSMDVPAFCAVMERWRAFFEQAGNLPVMGVTEEELRAISAPALLIPGFDVPHPLAAAERLHGLLPHSELVLPSAVFSAQEMADLVRGKGELVFFQKIAPVFADFITRVEAGEHIGWGS